MEAYIKRARGHGDSCPHTQTQRFYPLCCVGEPADLLYSPSFPPYGSFRCANLCYVRQSPTAIAGRLLLILQWILLPVRPDARSAEWVGERANPALKYPKLSKEGGLKPEDRALLAERLELILRVAVHKGHDVVVLGAMG